MQRRGGGVMFQVGAWHAAAKEEGGLPVFS